MRAQPGDDGAALYSFAGALGRVAIHPAGHRHERAPIGVRRRGLGSCCTVGPGQEDSVLRRFATPLLLSLATALGAAAANLQPDDLIVENRNYKAHFLKMFVYLYTTNAVMPHPQHRTGRWTLRP